MSGCPPSPGPRYQALLQLLRTAEALWNASRSFFTRWDLSPSQFNVLNLLYDLSAGCTQIELSRSLIMHRSNVTGLVDRLEARGLVQRRDVAHDRRAYRVVLTTAGKKLVRQILPDRKSTRLNSSHQIISYAVFCLKKKKKKNKH